MPVKIPRLKTPQQVEELVELLKGKQATVRCRCDHCNMIRSMYQCAIDALEWSLGKESKEYRRIILEMKRERLRKTRHQCAHAE
jgi:hypothetical protein